MKFARWLTLVAVVGGLGALVAWRLTHRDPQDRQSSSNGPVAVSVAAVTRATAHEAVTVTGVVRPHREAEVVAKVQGRVTQVLVALGEQVKVGQLLAVVEHEELGWRARQAQAAIETAQAGLESARQNLETVETQFGRVKALREAEAIPQVSSSVPKPW